MKTVEKQPDMKVRTDHHKTDQGSDIRQKVRTALSDRISQVAEQVGGNVMLASFCDSSESTIRNWRKGQSEPGVSAMVAIAKAGGVAVEWLATGEGEMFAGGGWGEESAQVADTARQEMYERLAQRITVLEAPQAQHGINEGAHAYMGVKAAVGLVMEALGDQAPHIGPARVADLIDAAHQALQYGIDPALVTRLIASASGNEGAG